jgi:ribosome biogenesis SPOUT family RNA methylase Rps3
MYERYYSEKSRCLYLSEIKFGPNSRVKLAVISRVVKAEEAYARIPELAKEFNLDSSLYHSQAISLISKANLQQMPEYAREYKPVVGGIFHDHIRQTVIVRALRQSVRI